MQVTAQFRACCLVSEYSAVKRRVHDSKEIRGIHLFDFVPDRQWVCIGTAEVTYTFDFGATDAEAVKKIDEAIEKTRREAERCVYLLLEERSKLLAISYQGLPDAP